MRNKSILHVVNIYFVLPYFIGEQFQYFSHKGYDIHVICSPSEELSTYASEAGFKFKEIPILRKFSIYQDFRSVISIYKYIKKYDIDIVCGHTPKGALLAMVASFFARVKIRLYFRHGLMYETSKGLKRNLLINIERITSLFSSKVVGVSPSVLKTSLKNHLNTATKQILLANGTCNGINTAKFSTSNLNQEKRRKIQHSYGIPNDGYIIGFTGRLVNDKGIVELVAGFESLFERYDNMYLLLVGMLETRDSLPHNIVELIDKHDHIITTGYVDNRDIEYLYSLMNVFILPSYREGFPTSILEASAMEIPVITTKATGCIDAIIEGATGLFVNHNSDEIEKAIEYFYQNSEIATEFGENGREFILNSFSQQLVWESIEKLYNTKQ